MKRLGISVYPEQCTEAEWKAYLKKAAAYGFTRVFTCFISANETKEEMKERFQKFCHFAHDLGFIVSADTNPTVFAKLGASPQDLSIFHEIGVDIIRLDGCFSEMENVQLSYNPYDIKIEYNSSVDIDMENLLAAGADRDRMCMCANFYPQRYTAMSLKRYEELMGRYQKTGLLNASFVSSQREHTYGPWSYCPHLPTLEMHRDLPIDLQTRHTFALGYVQDVLIGNAIAADEELAAMGASRYDFVRFKINPAADIREIEKKILRDDIHASRGENEIMLRSSYPRIVYKKETIAPRPHGRKTFEKGDVLIINDNYKNYAAEVLVIRETIEASDIYNYVGHLQEHEDILLPCVLPRHPFGFILEAEK